MALILYKQGLLIGWGCYFSMGRPLDSPVPMPEGTHVDCIDEPDRCVYVDCNNQKKTEKKITHTCLL
jgi:hypothetical protein